MNKILVSLCCLVSVCKVSATTWHVGSTRTYTVPSQVQNLISDGDTIYLDGGIYSNDAVKWTHKNLKFRGLGLPTNRTILRYTGNIPNGKGIWVFETPGTCDNAFIENIVFDGAQVTDAGGANGAGVRYQANNLTVLNCKFMNCQNGILEGNGLVTTSNVTILHTEFQNNGYQLPNDPTYSGYEHGIYINASTDTLLVMGCYFHDPRGQGNLLKTRAQRAFILYNMIDEGAGFGSWNINVAQGGLNVVMGNVIVQGVAGANHGIIGYDAAINPLEDFYFVNNTVINKYNGTIKYFNVVPTTGINTFKVYNNIFASVSTASNTFMTGTIPSSLDTSHNLIVPDYTALGFTNAIGEDYSLTAASSQAINTGINAGTTNTGYLLMPDSMYKSFDTTLIPRIVLGGTIDIGAYEYGLNTGIENASTTNWLLFPNPANNEINVECLNPSSEKSVIEIYNASGCLLLNHELLPGQRGMNIKTSAFAAGIYVINIRTGGNLVRRKITIVK
ncbi:MAG: T9SS type A sorting domain-containing protein [Chitinophagaceae bacterium]